MPTLNSADSQRGTRNAEHGTLVIQTAFLGDVVLTLPLITALAERHGPVDVVVTPESAALVDGQPSVRRVIPYDKRGADRGIGGYHRMLAILREPGYRRAIVPHTSLRSALLAWGARIPERIGFAGGLPGLFHTRAMPRPSTGHASARFMALLPDLPGSPPWLTLSAATDARVAAWLAERGLGDGFVVLAPGARWATKRWPGFPALARQLQLPTVVIGGPEDRAHADAIVREAPWVHAAAGDLALPESAALIARSRLVVSNDSVALHLAVALGRPVVAIAGPTGPAPGFAPPDDLGTLVTHPSLPCRPCSLHGHARCPLGHHRCMTEITSTVVLAAVHRALAATTRNSELGTRNSTGNPEAGTRNSTQ
ncbi:MAG TPA: lipopolysaccharide heptosyltransferase II [Gemmatimonadales bacterium]|nr:lipopolysaccharide heptosyltransferase II [Gemmatimonadales bacterium]